MDIKLISGVVTLHFLALISPGPDFVLAIRNSLQFGRQKGIGTALGFGAGIAWHVSYCIAGLAFLLYQYPELYHLIRYLGASYLIWIGISTLWALIKTKKTNAFLPKGKELVTFFDCVKQGFLTNVLNPKATLFIISIYTSVVPSGTSFSMLLLAGVLMVATTILWFSLVSCLFTTKTVQTGYYRIEKILNMIFALFFLAVGFRLIVKA